MGVAIEDQCAGCNQTWMRDPELVNMCPGCQLKHPPPGDVELLGIEIRPRTRWMALCHFFGFARVGDTLADGSVIVAFWHTGYGGGSSTVQPEAIIAANIRALYRGGSNGPRPR